MNYIVPTAKMTEHLNPVASELLQDALAGLTAPSKSISPKWLYDNKGSALFEKITALPEYYLTRTETDILSDHAKELVGLLPQGGALVEFGSGASVKTQVLLDAGEHLGAYIPIDISSEFLQETAADLRKRYPDLTINPVVGDFLQSVVLPKKLNKMPKMGFFPGSTIGNITNQEAQKLLSRARHWEGIEAFVLGVDLVKDIDVLTQAYDDASGVTEEFIFNILVRLNTELGANFKLSNFKYEAKWEASKARIEMSLISTTKQRVTLAGTQLNFAQGESIAISKSRKFTFDTLTDLTQACGWRVEQMLTDNDQKFAVAILRPTIQT